MLMKKFRVLVISEGGHYVSQALELDIAAQGKTIQEAIASFERTMDATISIALRRGEVPFKDIGPAPEWYQKKWLDAIPIDRRMDFSKKLSHQPASKRIEAAELAIA